MRQKKKKTLDEWDLWRVLARAFQGKDQQAWHVEDASVGARLSLEGSH